MAKIRFPTLMPAPVRTIGGLRQSQADGGSPATQEPPSRTIRRGRPVRRIVRAVLREFGLSGHRD